MEVSILIILLMVRSAAQMMHVCRCGFKEFRYVLAQCESIGVCSPQFSSCNLGHDVALFILKGVLPWVQIVAHDLNCVSEVNTVVHGM